jgi:hypothetical protein
MGVPGADQLLEVSGGKRLGEEEALRVVAAEALDQRELIGVLDALGDRDQI